MVDWRSPPGVSSVPYAEFYHLGVACPNKGGTLQVAAGLFWRCRHGICMKAYLEVSNTTSDWTSGLRWVDLGS